MHISHAHPVVEPVKASGPLAALEETYLTEGLIQSTFITDLPASVDAPWRGVLCHV
jgi:hypothetical protein